MTDPASAPTTKAPPTPHRVLVTGSAGAIGRVLCASLIGRGHSVRGFDQRPAKPVVPMLEDDRVGALTDAGAVHEAVKGMDTVIHLAAMPDDADFLTRLLEPNVIGLYHVFNAAQREGVRRVVVASSIQAVSGHDWRNKGLVRIEDGPAPTNHYALTKVWAEVMGQMYHLRYKMSGVAARIGWFVRNHRELESCRQSGGGRRVYLSHRDAARFFTLAVERPAEVPGYAVLFAASRSPDHPAVDLESARRALGYEPMDVFPDGMEFDAQGVVAARAWALE